MQILRQERGNEIAVMYYTPGHLALGTCALECVVHNYLRFLMETILWKNLYGQFDGNYTLDQIDGNYTLEKFVWTI